MLILYLENFQNPLIRPLDFSGRFLAIFYVDNRVIGKWRVLFFLSSTHTGCEQDLCLFLILEENHSVSRSIMLGCRYFRCSLSSGGSLPIYFFFFCEFLLWKDVETFSNAFSALLDITKWVFFSNLLICQITSIFKYWTIFFISGINYICAVLFTHCIIVFVNILLRIFTSIFIKILVFHFLLYNILGLVWGLQ